MTRKKYWELDICDEKHGSWGQQGVEVACKTWLSGGRLVVNKKTWYAHLFRTQGGDFGFPYPLASSDIEKAREYSRALWLKDSWPLAKHPFSWLLEKFKPIPDWHDPVLNVKEGKKKGIIYYTDNKLNLKIAHAVQSQLKKIGLPIVSASLKPMKFGTNIHIKRERGFLTMAYQILAALEKSDAEIVFFCEHDVLYHPSHFDFTPTRNDVYYYNTNVWRVRASDGHALYCDSLQQLSGLSANRLTILKHFKERVKRLEDKSKIFDQGKFSKYVREMGFEPGTHGRPERIDDLKAETYFSAFPNIDIRHDNNLTASRWNKDQFINEKYTRGWKEAKTVVPWNWPEGEFLDFIRSI